MTDLVTYKVYDFRWPVDDFDLLDIPTSQRVIGIWFKNGEPTTKLVKVLTRTYLPNETPLSSNPYRKLVTNVHPSIEGLNDYADSSKVIVAAIQKPPLSGDAPPEWHLIYTETDRMIGKPYAMMGDSNFRGERTVTMSAAHCYPSGGYKTDFFTQESKLFVNGQTTSMDVEYGPVSTNVITPSWIITNAAIWVSTSMRITIQQWKKE